ncbi:MAG TPA: hypothetical protein VNU68_25310 [Verrucomicrobiae bacterium]|nr:hypothetical protein [Verrucomicrobiae bacterium]
MKPVQTLKRSSTFVHRCAWLGGLAVAVGACYFQRLQAASQLTIWDTGAPLADPTDGAGTPDGWKAIPSELFAFEAEPAKAASDPGYYGREYSFQGDAIVANRSVTAVFWSRMGRVVLYSKAQATTGDGSRPAHGPGQKMLEFVPRTAPGTLTKISRSQIIRNAGDEVILRISFAGAGSAEVSALFTFGKDGIVEVKPDRNLTTIRLVSPVAYGVVPGFIGDDLIFSPGQSASGQALSLPADNVFVGLLNGEESQLILTWPRGQQQLRLQPASDKQGPSRFEAIDFDPDGQSLYVAVLNAPGIWHREELTPSHLEKDTALAWKRPFPARWKTQLTEAGVRTTFSFRESKGQIWRGVPGSYNYPVWFEGDNAFYHLSKKVPPKGESIIYFLEGQNTPPGLSTPTDVIKMTLGRPMSESILDSAGRKLRTHHRRGGDGVHRACTCGCTEAIQAIFEAGQEAAKQDNVKEALSDMTFFVQCHVERIDEYRRFASELIPFLRSQAAAPDLKSWLENLEQTAQQIPQEYEVQKENMKSLDHAGDLTRRTMALTGNKATNNLAAYMDLLKAWRAMGGAQDYVVAQCHTITRKLFQEAGYGCVHDPKAVAVAREIRARCRQVLRNPDGYEIWADY